jgi:FtsP/CotA-like multicopper oxidase with cupredoxin domain
MGVGTGMGIFDHFSGRTIYHCHVLDHDDRAMMAVVEGR